MLTVLKIRDKRGSEVRSVNMVLVHGADGL